MAAASGIGIRISGGGGGGGISIRERSSLGPAHLHPTRMQMRDKRPRNWLPAARLPSAGLWRQQQRARATDAQIR